MSNHNDHCCSCSAHHEKNGTNKSVIVMRLILSAVFLIIGILYKNCLSIKYYEAVCFSIFALSFIIAGFDVIIELFEKLFAFNIKNLFDEEFLMSIACFGAFALKEYSEAAVIMLFYQVGELFTAYAQDKSRDSISQLMDIRPESANLITDKGIKQISPSDAVIGDKIAVKPGEKVPLDGIIISGETYLDTAALTGESVPRLCKSGDSIMSGCINKSNLIEVEVTSLYSDSAVSKILELIENAEKGKTKSEKFINKFSRIYTPCVVLLAVLLCIIPPIITGSMDFSSWIHKALMFLVISCPCALVISVPLAFFCGIGGASKSGILIKGSTNIEMLSKIKNIAFDKTGTLTMGSFSITNVECEAGFYKDELIKTAALAESSSSHPVAKAIVNFYKENNSIDESSVISCKEISGLGIEAQLNLDGQQILVNAGNAAFMKSLGITAEQQPVTCVYIAVDGRYAGRIDISDTIKPESKQALSEISEYGINTIMLTGDTQSAAAHVADSLQISYRAELLPQNKVEYINVLKKCGLTAFAGDGINDAPSITIADVGIAMGGIGSDAAIEAADVVIMGDNPQKIAYAIEISKLTMKIAIENIIFSLAFKLIVMILCSTGFAGMYFAITADVGVSLVAVINSLRALIKHKHNTK